MVKSGDVLEHPITREKIVFRKTARDTGGKLCQVDFYLQPGGFVAAEHIHPLQEERFEVISGTLRGRVAGKELASGPGEIVVVPKGTPHVWWNSGDDEDGKPCAWSRMHEMKIEIVGVALLLKR
jgi:quercetin dioxygenase-like cupin family protein